ncbi:hypothetical protein [Methylomonas rhizoryzae]|uniref:hypothetical protein n=1 Tax=Methylomonas rhizoryzae TaxID=2608981 RepID=UPI001231ED37|nr:hypothetical protein [Methylomonas rhizoryzae]
MIRIVLVLLLLGQSMSAHAVSVIWKSGRSILVRTPSGIVAKPGIATLLQNVPDYVGGAISKATNPISVAGKTVTANVSRAITPANLGKAVGVAGRMNPAVSLAVLAFMGLQYERDPENNLPARQVPGDTTPPTQTHDTPGGFTIVNAPSKAYECGYVGATTKSDIEQIAVCVENKIYPSGNARNPRFVTGQFAGEYGVQVTIFSGTADTPLNRVTINRNCSAFPGTTWDEPSLSCVKTECPEGYTYTDSLGGMCQAPPQWQPISEDEIGQDAQNALQQQPEKAGQLVDKLLEEGVEPESEDTIADDPLPEPIRGDRTVKNSQGTDPATGDPTTTTETTEKTIDFQKQDSGKVVNITENTTVTTTTVNNVTNNVINNNVVNNVVNGSGDPVGDGGTDTDTDNGTEQQPIEWGNFSGQSPNDGIADGKAAIKDALSSACGGDCTNGPTETVSDRIAAFKSKYALSMGASGECPALIADLSEQGYGNHNVTGHCDLIENNRGAIATIFNIMIAIAFLLIIWSA